MTLCRTLVWGLTALVIAGEAGATEAPPAQTDATTAAEANGRRLAPFKLETALGGTFDIGPRLGRDVIYLAFWATWCKPCKLELEALAPVSERLSARGFSLVAVSTDGPDSIAEVEGYVEKRGYRFPVVLDAQSELLSRYNPRGDVPFSMVVDRAGNIVETHQGFSPGDEVDLEARLIALLEEVPGATLAHEPFLDGTETFRFSFLKDNRNGRDADDEVVALQNKLTLTGTLEPLSLGVRVDDTIFPGYDADERCLGLSPALCPWKDDHRIERVFVAYADRLGGGASLSVVGGDFVEAYGRGLVFSVRKVDELGLDTAIRGGRIRADIGPVSVRAFAGLSNVQNMDVVDLGFQPERADRLAGGEASVRLPGAVDVGLRASWVDYDESSTSNHDEGDAAFGGSVSAKRIAGLLSLYAEGAALWNLDERTSLVTGRTEDQGALGSAFYGSASLSPGPGLTILFEYKDYRRFEVQNAETVALPLVYIEPPTLERFDQIVPSTSNASGGRLLLQWLIPGAELLTSVNAVYYRWAKPDAFEWDEAVDLSDGKLGNGALHLYGAIERRFETGYRVSVGGGFRLEAPNGTFGDAFTSDFAEGAPAFSRRLWHVEGELLVPLVGPHSLSLSFQHRSEDKALPPNIKSFVRGDASVTWGWSPHLTAALLYTYESEAALSASDRYLNFAGEVLWQVTEDIQLGVFGGRNTGGIICVSGVCRSLPSFYGARFEVVARF
ncbi:MAG: TlpA family protein disulfide reductase [Myxococcales bacterium]|nr:TlpA family protein disulfide reductase [Myxococcales bacterium]